MINIVSPHTFVDYVTPEEMRRAEEEAASRGLGVEALMENAGRAVASVVDERYRPEGVRRVMVVCGTGNNGGDGFVAARYLKKKGWNVLVILLGGPFAIKTEEARKNWERVEPMVVSVGDEESLKKHRKYFERSDVIIDAILGTGVHGELREPAATAVRMINDSGAAKVAVDVPSGLDPLTGDASGTTVRADLTVALHRAKTGLRGKDEYTGDVVVAPIGID